MTPTPNPFTPAEIRDLEIIAARARFYGDDSAPITEVDWTDALGPDRVVPWLEAINADYEEVER